MRKFKILLAINLFAVSAVVSLQGQTTGEPVKVALSSTALATTSVKDDRYRIGFQDILSVEVYKHADLNRRVPVNPDGTILLFRLERPIVAVCKTERELATDIENAYREKYLKNPIVNVVVAEQRSQTVGVMGAVEKPNTYSLNRRIHLLELLAMAGGPNKEAGTRLIIARKSSPSSCRNPGEPEESDIAIVDLKLRDVQEGKSTFWMQPGDVVTVLDSDIIYVYGNVNRQGLYKIREPITLMQSVVAAEGLKRSANKNKVRVLRKKEGSAERIELIFDLNQIEKGKIRDPFLEPNDIVAISQDSTKAILFGFADAIKGSIPNAIYRLP